MYTNSGCKYFFRSLKLISYIRDIFVVFFFLMIHVRVKSEWDVEDIFSQRFYENTFPKSIRDSS